MSNPSISVTSDMDYTTQAFPDFDIMPDVLPELRLNDRLQLRKPHPCGGYSWVVVRLGADIGLVCETCGRRMLLPRRKLARSVKKILPPAEGDNEAEDS